MIVAAPIVFHVTVIPMAVISVAVIPTLVVGMSIIHVSIIHVTVIHVTIIAPICVIEAMIMPFATVATVFHAGFPEFPRPSGGGNSGPSVVRGSKKLAVAPSLTLVVPLFV
jgi:hypothetical protein